MTNFNQNNIGSQQFSNIPFSGSQATFQPGFAGTDAQHIRMQNAQSSQGQYSGYQQGAHMGGQSMMGMGHFGGPQAIYQPGFAGTDAQQVRMQNSQSSQGQYGYQQGSQMGGQSMMGMGHFGGPQAIYQPGFAGTDAQQVRMQNSQSSQGQYGYQQGSQMGGQSMMGMGHFGGPQAIYQPGFAGTDAQQVRQHNAQFSQGLYGGFQQGGYLGGQSMMGMGHFSGPQAVYQPGFAGTDAEQVRQQNDQVSQEQYGGYQQGGHMGGQSMMGMGHFGGPQAVYQPRFAGTDAQEVRQHNSQSLQNQNPIQ